MWRHVVVPAFCVHRLSAPTICEASHCTWMRMTIVHACSKNWLLNLALKKPYTTPRRHADYTHSRLHTRAAESTLGCTYLRACSHLALKQGFRLSLKSGILRAGWVLCKLLCCVYSLEVRDTKWPKEPDRSNKDSAIEASSWIHLQYASTEDLIQVFQFFAT